MEDFEKIEHLLFSKRYEELSPAEVREVASYFGTPSEYNDMRDTLLQVKTTLAADKILIKPSVELKEKLLQQFEDTYTTTSKNANTDKGNTRPFFRKKWAPWAAAAGVLLLVSLSILTYVQVENLKKEKQEDLALYSPVPTDDHTGKEKPVSTDPVVSEDATVFPGGQQTYPDGNMKSSEIRDEKMNTYTFDRDDRMPGEAWEGIDGNAGAAEGESSTVTENEMYRKEENSKYDESKSTLKSKDVYINDNNTPVINGDQMEMNKVVKKATNTNGATTTNPTGPDKSTHSQNQSLFNTSVNFQETTPNRDYYKTRGKNRTATADLKQSVADSLTVKMDSVNVDSNKNMNLERRANSKMPIKKGND